MWPARNVISEKKEAYKLGE